MAAARPAAERERWANKLPVGELAPSGQDGRAGEEGHKTDSGPCGPILLSLLGFHSNPGCPLCQGRSGGRWVFSEFSAVSGTLLGGARSWGRTQLISSDGLRPRLSKVQGLGKVKIRIQTGG